MIKHLFKEFMPLNEAYYFDQYTIWINAIGGTIIALTFFIVGFLCVSMADSGIEKKTKKTIILTQLFGLFLISCALARGIDVLCLWHNYAIVNGYVKILTGILSIAAVLMIPSVIRENIQMQKIHQKLDETNQKLDEVKELNDKLSK